MPREGQREKPMVNHVLAFIFALLAVTFAIMFFSTWVLIGVALVIVVLFAAGYGFAAVFGAVIALIIWLIGIIPNILGTLTNPFGGLI